MQQRGVKVHDEGGPGPRDNAADRRDWVVWVGEVVTGNRWEWVHWRGGKERRGRW